MSAHDNASRGVAPDPSAFDTFKWGIVGSSITLLVILACIVGFHLQVRAEQARKNGATENSPARQLRARQEAWIHSEDQFRKDHISITEAMGQIVDEAN